MCYKPKKKKTKIFRSYALWIFEKKHMITMRLKRFGPSRSVIVHKHICRVREGPLAADWPWEGLPGGSPGLPLEGPAAPHRTWEGPPDGATGWPRRTCPGCGRATSRATAPPPRGACRSATGERLIGPGSGRSGGKRANGDVHLPYVRGGIVFFRTRSILVGCGGKEPKDMKEESRRAF